MQLTARDQDLLRWINGHGFVTGRQAANWMGTCHQSGHRRMRLLFQGGYVDRERIFHRAERAYWITDRGLAVAQDSLSRPQEIRVATYHHDVTMVDVAQAVVNETSGCFVPERRLRHQQGLNGVGARGHVPDGLLHIGGKKPIAIELELSTKGSERLATIVDDYARSDLFQVWYFVTKPQVRRRLERITEGYGIFQIRDWKARR